jgi:hypothetical protein
LYWRSAHGKSAESARQGTAFLLAAVLVGVYLGGSTAAQIDPFYRSAVSRPGDSSYTTNGWRGANATPPPEAADIDYPYSGSPSPYEVARYVASSPFVRDSVVYVGGAVHDLAREDPPPAADPQSDLDDRNDYECVGCGDATKADPATDTASASSPSCHEGDWACFRNAPPPDDAPPADAENDGGSQ